MEYLFQLIGQIIPAILIFLLAWFFLKRVYDSLDKKALSEEKREQIRIVTPLRLQAYERLILMLERLTPNALVMRAQSGSKSVAQMQLTLLKGIREEFDHNISMQMYVSEHAWERVVVARDEIVQLVKIAGAGVNPESSPLELSRAMLEMNEKLQSPAWQVAVQVLKQEVRNLYN